MATKQLIPSLHEITRVKSETVLDLRNKPWSTIYMCHYNHYLFSFSSVSTLTTEEPLML